MAAIDWKVTIFRIGKIFWTKGPGRRSISWFDIQKQFNLTDAQTAAAIERFDKRGGHNQWQR